MFGFIAAVILLLGAVLVAIIALAVTDGEMFDVTMPLRALYAISLFMSAMVVTGVAVLSLLMMFS